MRCFLVSLVFLSMISKGSCVESPDLMENGQDIILKHILAYGDQGPTQVCGLPLKNMESLPQFSKAGKEDLHRGSLEEFFIVDHFSFGWIYQIFREKKGFL